MTYKKLNTANTATATAVLNNRLGRTVSNMITTRTDYDAEVTILTLKGRRTVKFVKVESLNSPADYGYVWDSANRLCVGVGICRKTGEFYASSSACFNNTVTKVADKDLARYPKAYSRRLDTDHARGSKLVSYVLDCEADLTILLKSL